eukprot:CAMPEP_0170402084 /NCGR_PEP_ID=MMETSP0117_2-20130122/25368_1 /TAXON_ID=400756 /ORGANISM="Durinskia baltica, Strain CSIRO CS-38" /LENGTH=60 /DNA_ID=CAMNT_0010658927 /DNA_START=205 /DNA_END=384 /DNA_ORIENTATION=-
MAAMIPRALEHSQTSAADCLLRGEDRAGALQRAAGARRGQRLGRAPSASSLSQSLGVAFP